jgi:hypothetical protein
MQLRSSFLLVAVVAACGGGDADPGMVNGASARASVDSVGDVSAQMTASNGDLAANAVTVMTSNAQSIVTPTGAAGRELVGLLPAHLPKPTLSSATTGTATCTPTSCTFDNYGSDDPTSGFTIDGTLSRSGDTITFDLTYDVHSASTTVHWDIDGNVTVTATSVDGNVHSKGETTGDEQGGFHVTWDVDVAYDAIQLDGAGCPVGGSITATSSYDVNAGGQSAQGYNVTGTATFGPACGTVTPS